jgi:NADH:ubiquinone oxidoreductase subunit 2 (subunit N)
MVVRMLVNGLPALAPDWQQMLAILAILSIALGNITAIAQSNLQRMLTRRSRTWASCCSACFRAGRMATT